MKRKFLALLIITATILATFCSCTAKEPRFFYDIYSFYSVEEFKNSPYKIKAPTASEEELKLIKDIFSKLCEDYNINKELPPVKILTKERAEALWGTTEYGGCLAEYNGGTLYLTEDNIQEGVIAHELCHYLSDNGTYGGVIYQVDDIVLGVYLNEGITNYFATREFKHSEYYNVYEYETHVATLLAIIFGEENLKKVFYSGDVTALRDDFNNAVKKYYGTSVVKDTDIEFEPFDAMASCLETYTLSYADAVNEALHGGSDTSLLVSLSLAEAQSIEEMLVFYAKEKGVKKEVEKEIKAFTKRTIIPFSFNLLF